MKKNINKIAPFFLPIILAGVFFAQTALAQKLPERTEDCNKLYEWFDIKLRSGDTNAIEGLPTICTAQSAFMWVIDLLLLFAGSVAVIFITIGGFKYLTSAGNEEQSEQGKKTLVTSIIGLVVVIMAATIVRIVANTLGTGKSSQDSQNPGAQQTPPQDPNPAGGFRQATPEEIEANKLLQQQGQTPR